MQHTELADAALVTFYQYAKHVEMVSHGAMELTLQMYSDGSGKVLDLANERVFLNFSDLKDLLTKLEEKRREQSRDY